MPQESETASQMTKDSPAKIEESAGKSVLSPSQLSEATLTMDEEVLVTEAEPDFKEMVSLPSKLIC